MKLITNIIFSVFTLLMMVIGGKAQVPAITTFSPSNGCAGTTVTIIGSNFIGTTAVTFGGVNASSFSINSANIITAVVGNGGNGVIKVTNASGTGISVATYAFASNITGTFAYVTNTNSNTVSVVNILTDALVSTVAVGSSPVGVGISPNGKTVYITNSSSNNVSVINTATNTVTATIAVGNNPYGIGVSPDGTKVYVANQSSGSVSVINTSDNTVIATILVGNSPIGISVNPDGTKIYAACQGSGSISVINTISNTVMTTVSINNGLLGTVINSNGTRLYIANQSGNTMTIVNTITNLVIGTVTIGNYPFGINISPDDTKVYIANYNSNSVSVINTATNTLSAIIAVGNNPTGVAISPDGTKLYVANSTNNSLSVINAATNNFITNISIGTRPFCVGNFITNVGTACTILPLNLLTFTAQQHSNLVNLSWQTTNEVNTSHFTIERSVDGTNFSDIGKVVVKGDGGYTYIDNQLPNTSVIYYRLQMVDKDGSFTYSKVVVVTLVDNRKTLVLFPNPVKNNLFVELISTKAEKITLQVTDLQGKILLQEDTQVGVDNASLSVNTSTLVKGSYLLLVQSSGGVQQKQFMKE